MAAKRFQGRRLSADSFVLRQQRPATRQPVLDPIRVADLLGIVSEMLRDKVHHPAMLHEFGGCALAEAAVGEEFRLRL